jgi:LMBR1 domain-containing protein 1
MGFFVSVGEKPRLDFDWFKDLLKENSGERVMSFTIAAMAVMGLLLFATYTAYGLAVWPIAILRGPTVTTSNNGNGRRPIRRESSSIANSNGADTNASTQLIRSKYSLRSNSNLNQTTNNNSNSQEIGGTRAGTCFRNSRRSFVTAFRKISRPFAVLLGIVYLVMSILLALSIFLTA